MSNFQSRIPSLTTLLWVLASVVAFGAFLVIAPNLVNPPTPTTVPTAVAIGMTPVKPTVTVRATETALPAAPPARKRTPAAEPTVPPGANLYEFVADPTRSGYLKDKEDKLHQGDRNLHAGFFGGDRYTSTLYFEIAQLPPNSEILSADFRVTGLSRDNLGAEGQWRAELIRLKPFNAWGEVTPDETKNAISITTIGEGVTAADLDLGQENVFPFSVDQIPALANTLGENTYAIVRLVGPAGPGDSLFTWDGGGMDLKTGAHPVLRIVARPGVFTIVTNTPTAENVITAAALALRETDFAMREGTPTPFPRTFATATPIVQVTLAPTPENVETRVAIAQVATAVALTTGTYTPTPENWIVVTPTFTPQPTRTPLVIAVSTLYARLTPTVPPTNTPTIRDLLNRPIPGFLKGNLLILTDRFKGSEIAVMRPDGTITQGLTGKDYYMMALTREPFSPDRRLRAVVAPDSNGILQIWMEEQDSGQTELLTHLVRGIAYDPVWSPDGRRIAYVSRESGNDEIYLYDVGTRTHSQITRDGNPFIFKQHPTWSPDSRQIAFKTNDGTLNFQIWMMDDNGANVRNISRSNSNDTNPVWIK